MARCAALAIPQGLDGAGKALNLKVAKDAEGRRLMLRMCKPKGYGDDGTVLWHETPEQLARLDAYCARDVESEAALDAVIPPLSASEREVWILDQHINERGVMLDLPLIEKATAVAERCIGLADAKIRELTGGVVRKASETARLIAWLRDRQVPAKSIAKGEVDDLLVMTDLFSDPVAREVIELRRAAAKSSVAKYRAMERSTCSDSRSRGVLTYHGASTGRWAGRLWQPQNLPRIVGDKDYSEDVTRLRQYLTEYPDVDDAFDMCTLMFGNPLEVLSRALRSMLVAAPGCVFIGGDYSNIEGRVNAWLAGEDWKVKAFADFDQGEGGDLYMLAFARAFNIELDAVTKDQRQVGKVMELSLGYQGGVRAFQKMGVNYSVSVTDERADELKFAWREANPAIVASWYDLQDAAIEAVRAPGMKVPCCGGRIQYLVAHGILWCRLPSGRALSYVSPRIESGTCPTCHGTGSFDEEECADCWGRGSVKARVAYMGVNSLTKQWGPQRLYGGRQCENVVQAIARDVMVEGMLRLEAAGYPTVLTVHDEVLAEVPEGFGSPEEFAAIMSAVPTWAEGLPVAVGAWKDHRYVK
jgi:DNA polymerase